MGMQEMEQPILTLLVCQTSKTRRMLTFCRFADDSSPIVRLVLQLIYVHTKLARGVKFEAEKARIRSLAAVCMQMDSNLVTLNCCVLCGEGLAEVRQSENRICFSWRVSCIASCKVSPSTRRY